MTPPAAPAPEPPTTADDAAWNTVILAALGYHAALNDLRRGLAYGRAHGMTTADMVHATQLDEATIARLLWEADL